MARIRTIKPEFFTSDDTCALSPLARLLYIGLWCESDREGRFVWAPKAFKRRYLPEDDCDVDELCEELRERGLVVLYGDNLARIPTFSKHQHVNPREALSVLPSPDGPPDDASPPVSDASVTRREEGKEREGREQKERKVSRARGALKTELAENWKPTEDELAYAKAHGCPDPADTAERFRLHHRRNATKHADWTAAFQYWCRNEKNFRLAKPQASTPMTAAPEPWEQRLKNYKPGGMWQPNWGPRPESGKCWAPKELLATVMQ